MDRKAFEKTKVEGNVVFIYYIVQCIYINFVLFIDLHVASFIIELSSDVDIGCPSVHAPTGYEATLYQFMRIMSHDLTILASTRFTLVCIDN